MAQRKKQDVKRLRDLQVHEVSVVDLAANGRRFSMVKSEDGMPQRQEIQRDEKGDLISDSKPAVSPSEGEPYSLSSVFTELGKAFTTENEEIAKRLTVPEEVKMSAYKALRDAQKRLWTALETMGSAETADGESDLAKLIGEELVTIATELGKLGKSFGAAGKVRKSDPEQNDLTKALEMVGVQVDSLKVDLGKRGAKMASNRLKSFEDAIGKLTKILNELKGAQFPQKAEKALEKRVDDLEAKYEASQETIKKQAAELKKLRTARPASSAIPVEKGAGSQSQEENATSWPLDLNDERTPETVDKAVSFYD